MTGGNESDEITVHYKLRRDECPRLFDALASVPKGIPRANRLKVLVLTGHNAECGFGEGPKRRPAADASSPECTNGSLLGDMIAGKTED